MPSTLVKTLLFLSSYFPLFAILSLLSFEKNRFAAYTFAAIGIVSWVTLEIYLWYARTKINPEVITIRTAQRRDAEVLNYIVAYLIPFMADFSKPAIDLAALAIFFVVIGFLYVTSNMIHINPLLNIRGYHLFEVTLADGTSHSLLTKSRLRTGMTTKAVLIGESVFLEI
jgi:hypothetical protein